MIKIRLKRLGAKRTPFYRIVVINSASKREGKPVQELGYYNPKTKEMKLNKEAALEWVKKGAQPTETVQYLLNNCKADGSLDYKPKKEKKLSKKSVAKAEAEKEAKAKPKEETAEAEIKEEATTVEPAAEETKPAAEEAPVEEAKAEETPAEA